MKSWALVIGLIMLFCKLVSSQEEKIEFIAEGTERNLDYSELLEKLEHYRENPMDINQAGAEEIQSLQILEPILVRRLIDYREKYGCLLTIYELLAIEGFNKEIVNQLTPFIRFGSTSEKKELRATTRRLEFDLLARYSRILEKQKGYRNISIPEWQENPNTKYMGSPDRLYFRSSLTWKEHYQAGIIAEKDAGEPILPGPLPDTFNTIGRTFSPVYFDFASAYVLISDVSIMKKFVVGDYHLRFGQGLTFWSGMSYGKTADATNIKRYGTIIKPNSSANENGFMRGSAAWVRIGSIDLIAFFSNHHVDANLKEVNQDNDGGKRIISSLLESGYHRTLNEMKDMHATKVMDYGGRIQFINKYIKAGLSGCMTQLDASFEKQEQLHNYFTARGKEFANLGLDMDLLLFKKANLFGELASDRKGSVAFMAGMVSMLHPRLTLAMLYRNYPAGHVNLRGNGFSESGSIRNEKGFYIGLNLNPLPNILIKAYADLYRFPWLRYGVDSPSSGFEMLTQISYAISPELQVYLRYRCEHKQKNHADYESFTNVLVDGRRQSLRFHLSCQVSEAVQLRGRMEWTAINPGNQQGLLIYNECLYRPKNKGHRITARIALFDTDSYQSRVYAYEHDVLYASSVPSFYGQGTRIYVIYNLQLTKYIGLWFRLAQTYYYDRNIIGTGLDQIDGRTKSEIRFQLRIKI
jgi:hypothetical protein